MVLLIILLLLILGTLICIALIFSDDNTDKYTAEPSDDIITVLASGAFLDNEAYLSEDLINGMIAEQIDNAYSKGYFYGDLKLNALYIDIFEDEPCKVYLQINYKGRDIGFSADADMYLSGDSIVITLDNVYAGKLKIPSPLAAYALSKSGYHNLYENISLKDLSIKIPSEYNLDIGGIGANVYIEIQQLELYNNAIYVKTNDIVNDVLENNDLFEIFKTFIGDKIFDTFTQYKDNITDYIPDSFSDIIGNFYEQ